MAASPRPRLVRAISVSELQTTLSLDGIKFKRSNQQQVSTMVWHLIEPAEANAMFWKPGLTQGAPTGWRSRDRSGAQGQCGSQRAGHYRCWKSPPPFKSMWPEACWGEGYVGDAQGTKRGDVPTGWQGPSGGMH